METLEITKLDYTRLNGIISTIKQFNKKELKDIMYLENEIKRAQKKDPKKISPNFVTMNSIIEVTDLDIDRTMEIELVYPKDADFKSRKVSVLSPFGSALLGYKAGSTVTFQVPKGLKKIRIDRILYQPEASGEYFL